MLSAVPGDDVDDTVVTAALGDRHRGAVLVEQVRMERPADDLVGIEIDLQHARISRDAPSRVPYQVTQRVGDQFPVGEVDRLHHMRAVTYHRVGSGIHQLPRKVPLRSAGTRGEFDTPVNHGDHHIGRTGGRPNTFDDSRRRGGPTRYRQSRDRPQNP